MRHNDNTINASTRKHYKVPQSAVIRLQRVSLLLNISGEGMEYGGEGGEGEYGD